MNLIVEENLPHHRIFCGEGDAQVSFPMVEGSLADIINSKCKVRWVLHPCI